MRDSFIVFSAECVNTSEDSICRLCFKPVVNGEIQQPKVYYINPEAHWEATFRSVDRELCLSSPTLKELWKELEELFMSYDMIIPIANGYSARVLWYHLKRLAVDFKHMEFVNANTLCRKLYPGEFSYSYYHLSLKYCPAYINDGDIKTLTNGWAELINKGLENLQIENLRSFAENNNIIIGKLDMMEFVPSGTIRDYSLKNRKLDFSDVEINIDEDNPFFEKNVVFTGKLEKITRSEARKLVVSVGGAAPETLTKSTNYLVVGVQDLRVVGEKGLSGKMKKAAAFKEKGADIELIDENDFFEMFNYK